MAAGDVSPVTAGEVSDVYCIDTEMFDVAEMGAVYAIDAERPAIVDAGLGTNHEAVLDALESIGIAPGDLDVIALTHVHLDHAGGAGFIAEACPNAEVLVHPIGAPHAIDLERLVEGTKRAVGDQWRYYVEPEPIPAERVVEVEGGDAVDLGDRTLDVYHAPGHAPHQVVFHEPTDDAVFTADAAGLRFPALGRVSGTSPPPNFDLEGCLEDVGTIRTLDPAVLCYAHFGAAETDDRLEEYERVLTDWVESVETVREERHDDEAVIEHFVERQDLDAALGQFKAREETEMNVRGVLHYLDRREE